MLSSACHSSSFVFSAVLHFSFKDLTLPEMEEKHFIPFTLLTFKYTENFVKNCCNMGAELMLATRWCQLCLKQMPRKARVFVYYFITS